QEAVGGEGEPAGRGGRAKPHPGTLRGVAETGRQLADRDLEAGRGDGRERARRRVFGDRDELLLGAVERGIEEQAGGLPLTAKVVGQRERRLPDGAEEGRPRRRDDVQAAAGAEVDRADEQ